jgi:hypothetical protein
LEAEPKRRGNLNHRIKSRIEILKPLRSLE